MHYPARFYSQALISLIKDDQTKSQETIVGNFLNLLKKNGDSQKLPEIIRLTERSLAKKKGGREVLIETARPLPGLKERLKHLITPADIVHETVNPSIVAGVRITIDGELQIDGSLRTQLDRLLAPHPTL